jgi:hypothetical protein
MFSGPPEALKGDLDPPISPLATMTPSLTDYLVDIVDAVAVLYLGYDLDARPP